MTDPLVIAMNAATAVRKSGGQGVQFAFYEFSEAPGQTTCEAFFETVDDKKRIGYGLARDPAEAIMKATVMARAYIEADGMVA